MPTQAKIVIIGNKWVDAGQLYACLCPRPEIISLPEDFPVQQLDFLGKFSVIILNRCEDTYLMLEKIQQIRSNFPDLPILLALPDQTTAAELAPYFLAGVAALLLPDFAPDTMSGVLNAFLEQKKPSSFFSKVWEQQAQLHFMPPVFREMSGTKNASTQSVGLDIRFLGPLRVSFKGQVVNLPKGTKLRSLLANLLYESPKKQLRYQLLQRFWPDVDQYSSSNSLSVNLCNLRSALRKQIPGEDLILYDHERYCINPDIALHSDIALFSEYYRTGCELIRRDQKKEGIELFLAATGLYQGDFLEDLKNESWTIHIRETLMEHYFNMLEQIAAWQVASNTLLNAIETLKQIEAKDDCIERVHRQLIVCYLNSGKPEEAIRQYKYCQHILKEKMDRKPDLATTELLRHLLAA